jgi:hypothetical protein
MGAVRLSFVLKEILVKHRLFTPQLAESCGVFFCPFILQTFWTLGAGNLADRGKNNIFAS